MASYRQRSFWVNSVTGSRLFLAIGVAVLTPWLREGLWAIILATALVVLVEITDLIDGYLARLHDVVSDWGKMFDPYSDSIARLTIYWSLAVAGRCWVVLPLVMAVRDVTVGYARILMTRQGQSVAARYTGKLKALVQGAGALVLVSGPLWWGDPHGTLRAIVVHATSGLVLVITGGSMIDYAAAAFRRPKANANHDDTTSTT
jgi:CDP-diacylglycerol--glycerol-3-phosphate 3-phosphatidyltransferase